MQLKKVLSCRIPLGVQSRYWPSAPQCCRESRISNLESRIYALTTAAITSDMPLLSLPNELLLCVAKCLDRNDLNSLCQTNHRLGSLLASLLHEFLILDKDQVLTWAAQHGRLPLARLLLKEGANVRAWEKYERTALYLAVAKRDVEMARLLLEHGALIDDDRGEYRQTALHVAVGKDSVPVTRLLLDHGADVNAIASNGFTPLHYAALDGGEAVAELLIERGCDFTVKRLKDWATPLHYAAYHGNEGVTTLLLRCGADVHQEDLRRQTVLHYATSSACQESVVRMLLEKGAEIAPRDWKGMTPFLLAASRGSVSVVELLLERGASFADRDEMGRTALHLAAECRAEYGGQASLIDLLLRVGLEVDSRDSFGGTPLQYAAGEFADHRMAELLKNGADVDARADDGRTALHQATRRAWLEIIPPMLAVKLLLDHGADIDAQDNGGLTPLHLVMTRAGSIARTGPFESTIKLFLERGAKVNTRDKEGQTPLHYAARAGEKGGSLFDLLVEYGADLLARDKRGTTPEDIRMGPNVSPWHPPSSGSGGS